MKWGNWFKLDSCMCGKLNEFGRREIWRNVKNPLELQVQLKKNLTNEMGRWGWSVIGGKRRRSLFPVSRNCGRHSWELRNKAKITRNADAISRSPPPPHSLNSGNWDWEVSGRKCWEWITESQKQSHLSRNQRKPRSGCLRNVPPRGVHTLILPVDFAEV